MTLGNWVSLPTGSGPACLADNGLGRQGAVSIRPGRVDAVILTSDHHVRHVGFDADAWKAAQWQSLFGPMVSAPSLISWGPGRLDVFALGLNDHRVHHKWGAQQPDGQIQWSPFGAAWDPPIGNLLDPQVLTVTIWGPGRLDVFARGGAGDVVHMFYDAHAPNTHGGWGRIRAGQVNWETLGGQILGSPVAVSWGPGRIDLFAVGTNSYVYLKSWDGHHRQPTYDGGWAGPLGDRPVRAGSLCVVSDQPGRIDLFALAEDSAGFDEVVHKHCNFDIATQQWGPSANHGWRSLGRPIHGTFWQTPALTGEVLTATSCRPDRIDLFGAGMLAEHDLRLHYLQLERVNDTLVGAGWTDLGGQDPHQSRVRGHPHTQRHRQHPRQPRPLRARLVDHMTHTSVDLSIRRSCACAVGGPVGPTCSRTSLPPGWP